MKESTISFSVCSDMGKKKEEKKGYVGVSRRTIPNRDIVGVSSMIGMERAPR
jgi:hypothetical protein